MDWSDLRSTFPGTNFDNFTPLHDFVLVKELPEESLIIKSELHMTKDYRWRSDRKKGLRRGLVVLVGKGDKIDGGTKRAPMHVRNGDVVVYPQTPCNDIVDRWRNVLIDPRRTAYPGRSGARGKGSVMANNNSARELKGQTEHITLRPAKGGVVSEISRKFKRGGQGGGPLHDYEHETAVHPTMDHLVSHIEQHMGKCFSGGPANREADGKSQD